MSNNRVDTAMIMKLCIEPNPILHKPSEEVQYVDTEIKNLMDRMLLSMYHYHGVGLAAVQVGVLKKVIVIDVGPDHSQGIPQPMFLINAKIIERSEVSKEFNEGCLSFPDIYYKVTRPESIKVSFLDYYGKSMELHVEHGLLSACIQHEIDHTNGTVFIDHLSKLKQSVALKKMIKRAQIESNNS